MGFTHCWFYNFHTRGKELTEIRIYFVYLTLKSAIIRQLIKLTNGGEDE